MTHLSEEQLILHHYRDAEDPASAEEHLAACGECRARLDALAAALAAVDTLEVPARPSDYGARVWQRLRARLDEPPRAAWFDWFRRAGWLVPQRLALAGAMGVLVIAAFLLGRMWPGSGGSGEPAVAAEVVRERVLLVAVGEHLERSHMVLVELVNTPSGGAVNISNEQRWAEELVGANRIYRQAAARAGEAGISEVLDELERVLLEIAHSPSEVSSVQLARLQKKIEARGILFKVRVIGSQVEERQRREVPAASAARATS